MRKAVTFLQSVARFRTNELISEADVREITGVRRSMTSKNNHQDDLTFGFNSRLFLTVS